MLEAIAYLPENIHVSRVRSSHPVSMQPFRLHVVWETMVNGGLSTPNDFVRMVSSAAAKAFNIYPRKGLIAPGSDADVIIFDPDLRHTISAATHHSAVDVNVYEGMQVTGKVCLLWSGLG